MFDHAKGIHDRVLTTYLIVAPGGLVYLKAAKCDGRKAMPPPFPGTRNGNGGGKSGSGGLSESVLPGLNDDPRHGTKEGSTS
jgi:hypothetical protein